MPTLSDLTVKVGIDAGGWTRGLQSIAGDLKDLDRDIKGMERALAPFERMGERMSGVGTALSIGITAPLGLATNAVAGLSGAFDLEMAKVSSLMRDVSAGEMKTLHDGVLALSERMGIDAVGGANALYEAISAGIPKENALDFLATASQAAIAGVTDTKVAVDGITSVLNAYHLQASDAKTVSDQMFQAVNVGKFTFDQLASSISIATPLAAQLGVDFGTLVSTAATLTSQGFSVSEAMTSIRGAMVAMVSPNKDMNALIAETQYESGQAMVKALGFQGALGLLREKADGNITTLTNAFGRVEALGAALGVTGDNAKTAAGHLDTVTNSAGATQAAFDKITATNAQQWDQLKNRIEAVAIQAGSALAPAISSILDLGNRLVTEVLSPAVKWFTDLPQPVQSVGLAFGAVAAAAGPVLFIAGQLIGSITTIYPLFISLAGSLGGVTTAAGAAAAPTALGALATVLPVIGVALLGLAAAWAAWTFQDDLPGLVLLKGAFELVKESTLLLWEAFKFIAGTVVDTVKPAFAWLLGAVTGFTSPLSTFAGWIGEVTSGMRGLRAIIADTAKPADDAKKALEKLNKNALDPISKSSKLAAAGLDDFGRPLPKVKKDTKELKEEIAATKDETHKLIPKNEILYSQLQDLEAQHKKTTREVAEYRNKVWAGKVETVDFAAEAKLLADRVGNVDSVVGNLSNITLPPFIQRMNDIAPPTNAIKDALKTLGIEGSADLQKVADKAAEARDVVLGSNLATDFEKKTAVYKALKAQVDAAVAAGRDVPAEQTKMLEKMETELNIGKGKDVVTASSGMFAQVSTIITNFAQDAANVLFNGELSWGEKVKKLWGNLQQSLVSTFIEPATQVLTDFIEGVLKDLITGKGFGGVLGQISKIGTELKDVFGAGGVANPTPTPTTVPGGGGAGGAGGAASSAASGVMGIVGAIGSVATAVSSIVGNFQMMGMNKSLDVIVQHTLQTANDLANLRRDEWDREGHLMLKLDDIWRTIGTGFSNQFTRLGELYDLIDLTSNAFLDRIARAVEPVAAGGAGMATGGLTVNFNNVTFHDRSDIDYALSQLSRNYR